MDKCICSECPWLHMSYSPESVIGADPKACTNPNTEGICLKKKKCIMHGESYAREQANYIRQKRSITY